MRRRNIIIKYIILMILLLLAFALNICLGSVSIRVDEVLKILIGQGVDYVTRDIVIAIRLPRAISAILTGGALALSGYLLQAFFRNPIAGPFILGISSGAKLMVALMLLAGGGIAIGGAYGMIAAAFLGAILSMLFVLLCSKKVNSIGFLLVCGVMIGYICTAITDFIVTFASDADIINLHNWSRGSLSGMTWETSAIMTGVILVVSVVVFFMSKPMSAYIMGESYAVSLGLNIKLFRTVMVILSSMLAATVTAFVGPVSFVGIAVPHIARFVFKDSKPIMIIPASFIIGGTFTLGCDLIARLILSPTELSISTVTAIFGAPIVIYLLIQNKMGH